MDSEQQEKCAAASRAARYIEESMLTVDDVMNLSESEIEEIDSKAREILECMDLLRSNLERQYS